MSHYNKGGEPNPFLDGGIVRLALTENEIDDWVAPMLAFTSEQQLPEARAELERQQKIAAANRPIRDTEAATTKKGHRGDVPPDPTTKDWAQIGGRPSSS